MKASRLLLLTVALLPAILLGQKKEDLASIQRDIADMDDHVKQLQKAYDTKIAELTALLQQSLDAQNKQAALLQTMQHNIDQKLADQQTKLVAPVATLGTKVDEMSGDFRSVRENVAELVRHMNDMDSKIADMSSAIRAIQTPAPPPSTGVPLAGGTVPQAPDGPPAGWSAEQTYQSAYRDYQGKKDDLAIEEFAQYVKFAPQSENAPNAEYYVGMIYWRGEDYENAVKAFDAVLEKFPANAKTPEAQYMKACALMKGGHKTAAGTEFKSFIAKYPESPRAKDAHIHLVELGMAPQKKRASK
jgi:TolA-binding protein